MPLGTSLCLVYEILPHDPGAKGEVSRQLCRPVPAAQNSDIPKVTRVRNAKTALDPMGGLLWTCHSLPKQAGSRARASRLRGQRHHRWQVAQVLQLIPACQPHTCGGSSILPNFEVTVQFHGRDEL